MLSIEKTGKTVEEALEQAVLELKTTIGNIEYEVIDQGSKGFLGFGSKPAKISAKLKFDPVSTAKNFLREVFICMKITIDFDIVEKDNRIDITLKGEDIGVVIGKRGQTLDSLQYIVNLAVNKGNAPYINISLDAENYRARRKDTLEKLAVNLAKKVKLTGKDFYLEPMSSFERRIIHSTLQGDKYISTYSKGEEPYRHVVISLKK